MRSVRIMVAMIAASLAIGVFAPAVSAAPPGTPTNVAATPLSNTSIRVDWTDTTGETSYSVYRWNGVAWVNKGTPGGNAITFTDSTIDTPGLYYYLVCANNADGQTCANYVSANNSVNNNPPSTPSNVSATPLSNTSIRLNWTDSTGETSYSFYRWSGSAWVNKGTGAQHSTTFTDSTIVTPGLYYYLVCANNHGGQTCANYVSANNGVGGDPKPSTPGNVTATALSSSSIRVNWTDSSGETSYSFYRWTGSTWAGIGTGAQNATTFSQSGLAAGTTYYYLVCANNNAGQTCANWVSVTTSSKPSVPGNVSATPLSNTSIRVNWTDSSGETSYSFYRWNGSAWAAFGTGAQNAITFTDNTIVTPGTYYYLVCANNTAGQTCANWVSANNSPF